jgi:hypothetical protein
MPLQFAFSVLEVLGSLLEICETTFFFKHIRRENRSMSIYLVLVFFKNVL